MTYQDLVNSFVNNPRDVHTVPQDKRIPRWFCVSVEKNVLYVERAKENYPSSSISTRRSINEKEFDSMLDLYMRRKKGESVSKEAIQQTVNQVYWYGIFNEMGL